MDKLRNVDWSIIIDWDYLVDRRPSEIFIYEQWIYIFVLSSLIFSAFCFTFIAKIFTEQKPKYRFIKRISFLWFSNTIFLLLYNLLRSEGVYFLSMRLFLVFIGLFFIVIVVYSVIYWVVKMPGKMNKFNDARLRDKYLRKKKK